MAPFALISRFFSCFFRRRSSLFSLNLIQTFFSQFQRLPCQWQVSKTDLKVATSQLAHLEKFSLNFFKFVIFISVLIFSILYRACFFVVYYYIFGVFFHVSKLLSSFSFN